MSRDHDRKRAECGRGTQNCADVLGIAQLIEDDDDAPSRCRASGLHILQIGLGEWFDFEREPLMNGVARQDRREAALIEHGYRRAAAAPRRPGGGGKSGCFLLVAGENNETVPEGLRPDLAMHTFPIAAKRRRTARAGFSSRTAGCVSAGPGLTKSSRHPITRVPLRRAARDPEGLPSG